MVKKKLLTLACAVGILAEDRTGGNLFDPITMSDATTANFNRLWKEFPLRAVAFSAGRPGDATLRITVLRQTASCIPGENGKQFCTIELIASFNVTTADGKIFQSKPDEHLRFGLRLHGGPLPENWNSNPFREEAAYALAMTAGDKLLLSAPAH